jgi:hypothetical protein
MPLIEVSVEDLKYLEEFRKWMHGEMHMTTSEVLAELLEQIRERTPFID